MVDDKKQRLRLHSYRRKVYILSGILPDMVTTLQSSGRTAGASHPVEVQLCATLSQRAIASPEYLLQHNGFPDKRVFGAVFPFACTTSTVVVRACH